MTITLSPLGPMGLPSITFEVFGCELIWFGIVDGLSECTVFDDPRLSSAALAFPTDWSGKPKIATASSRRIVGVG